MLITHHYYPQVNQAMVINHTCIFACISAFASGAGIALLVRWVTRFEVSPRDRTASALFLEKSIEGIWLYVGYG